MKLHKHIPKSLNKYLTILEYLRKNYIINSSKRKHSHLTVKIFLMCSKSNIDLCFSGVECIVYVTQKPGHFLWKSNNFSSVLFDYLCGMLTRKKKCHPRRWDCVPTNDKNVKDACVNHICNIAGAAAAKNSCQFWQVSKGSWL